MAVRLLASAVVAALWMVLAGCEPPGAAQPSGVSLYSSSDAPPVPPPPPAPPPPPIVEESQGAESAAFTAADAGPTALPADERHSHPPAGSTPQPSSPPAASSPPVQPQTPQGNYQSPTAPRQPAIRLSAGVALPQLLPEGTQIGVSVDYKLTGQLNQSSRYVLVVESNAGSLGVPVTLSPSGGTLQGFLPLEVRPEHAPFRARIDEHPPSGSPVAASNTLPLQ
jgi:hypothetical protein